MLAMPEPQELLWIGYCRESGCDKYLQNILIKVVVPFIVEGMEDMVDLRCECCNEPLNKIRDNFIEPSI